MSRIRQLTAMAISVCPGASVRAQLYRTLFGYEIGKGTRIGLGVVIDVDRFSCGPNVTIRRGTSFIGPMRVELGESTFIGRWNRISCGGAAGAAKQAHMGYARHFEMGRKCLIHESHFFDVYGRITIGDGTWIAGAASQFWTHGVSVPDRDIDIGRDCYLGSAVRFVPGSGIGDRVILAVGAVVTKRLPDHDVIIGGLPAHVLRPRNPTDPYLFESGW